jgi:hypothetical protein
LAKSSPRWIAKSKSAELATVFLASYDLAGMDESIKRSARIVSDGATEGFERPNSSFLIGLTVISDELIEKDVDPRAMRRFQLRVRAFHCRIILRFDISQ